MLVITDGDEPCPFTIAQPTPTHNKLGVATESGTKMVKPSHTSRVSVSGAGSFLGGGKKPTGPGGDNLMKPKKEELASKVTGKIGTSNEEAKKSLQQQVENALRRMPTGNGGRGVVTRASLLNPTPSLEIDNHSTQ